MANGKLTVWEKTKAAMKWVDSTVNSRPRLVNLEVTKKCNARCGFCPYWMTKTETIIDDYAAVIERFRPMVVTISGGEPTLRKDLVDIVRNIKNAQSFVYVAMVTNGSLMTRELAEQLFDAGLSQLNFSVDFPDKRHDEGRGLPGNIARIQEMCRDFQDIGFDRISFNTFIMKDNLDDVVDIAQMAADLNVSVSFSTYSVLKTDKDEYMIGPEDVPHVAKVIEQLIDMKRRTGHIRNSDYYLRRIPEYFAKGALGGCEAGRKWIHVNPEGLVQPCSELEPVAHYSSYTEKDLEKADICDKCWFACRGESSAPIDMGRISELGVQPSFDSGKAA